MATGEYLRILRGTPPTEEKCVTKLLIQNAGFEQNFLLENS